MLVSLCRVHSLNPLNSDVLNCLLGCDLELTDSELVFFFFFRITEPNKSFIKAVQGVEKKSILLLCSVYS